MMDWVEEEGLAEETPFKDNILGHSETRLTSVPPHSQTGHTLASNKK